MKTTIEISDVTLKQARKLAAREGTTLRALVELGLRRVIVESSSAESSSYGVPPSKAKGLR